MMPIKFIVVTTVCLTAFSSAAIHASQDAATPQEGFKAGESMPVKVVGFLAGAKSTGGGCPAVMISNARTRGMVIWARDSSDDVFKLAGALEDAVNDVEKLRVFLICFDQPAKEHVEAQAKTHDITRLFLTTSRSLTLETFNAVDGNSDSEVIIFFLDRKIIKSRQCLKAGELTDETIGAIATEAKRFITTKD